MRLRQALKRLGDSAEPALSACYCIVVATLLTCPSVQASKSDVTKATSNASKASRDSGTTDVASSLEVYHVVEARHGRVLSGQIVVPA